MTQFHPQGFLLNEVLNYTCHEFKRRNERTEKVKASTSNAGDPGSIPGLGRSPGEGMVTHSSILAWGIPWKEEPGGLQSTGSQRVGHDRATSLHFTSLQWYQMFRTIVLKRIL